MKKAFKYRLYPNKEQQQCLAKQFGSVRFVYNNALAFKKEAYDRKKTPIGKYDLVNRLVSLKQEYPWLAESDSQALQQSICHLDRAFKNFFAKRAAFPRFKNKYSRQSLHYPQRVKINQENKKIYLPKVGWVKIILHRIFEGHIKTVTISKTASGNYYASVLCETAEALSLVIDTLDQEKILGLDLGLHDIVVSSTGFTSGNPKFIARAYANLRRKQQQLSRKKIGSKRRNKARILVAKAHEKVTASRSYFQHVMTKYMVDENATKGMMRNRKLSKALADASWHSLVSKLEYKLAWQGKHLIKIDRFHPSTKVCNSCGKKQDMPLSKRIYRCPCGWQETKDINAALNIRKQGIEKLKAAGYTQSTASCSGYSWRLV